MKKYRILFCLFFFSAIAAQAQERSLDSLIQKVFRSFKLRDEQAYVKLFPNRQQMIDLSAQLFPVHRPEDKEMLNREMGLSSDSAYAQKAHAEFLDDFREAVNAANDMKLRWDSLKLESYTLDSIPATDNSPMIAHGVLKLNDGRQYVDLAFTDILWSIVHQGWMGVGLSKPEPGVLQEGTKILEEVPQATSLPPPPPSKKKEKKRQ
ncbi:MAG TPA: hypothetical protein VFR58_01020 [Flavisolibacter sp.]|nr:hypothetical protein [Flavisolibacter sp.]